MFGLTIEMQGLDKFLSNLGRYTPIAEKWLNTAIKTSIYDIETKTKPITPIDTGRLRSSFVSDFKPLIGTLENIAPYAVYVHEGTRFMEARPFLEEGINIIKEKIEENFKEAVERTMKEISEI